MPNTVLIAANWKMNGQSDWSSKPGELSALFEEQNIGGVEALICPSALYVSDLVRAAKGTTVMVGAQDCHGNVSGAHTGDISAEMIHDVGGTHCIVGHSERRADHGESSAVVSQKAKAANSAGLVAIICVGETRTQREAGEAEAIVGKQIADSVPEGAMAANTVIAYEPVWAIGTGLTPSTDDITAMHAFIRGVINSQMGEDGQSTRILYGGSVKPGNAKEILSIDDVDGALVGGASLDMVSFAQIISAAG